MKMSMKMSVKTGTDLEKHGHEKQGTDLEDKVHENERKTGTDLEKNRDRPRF